MSLDQAIQEARRSINADPIVARLGYGDGNIYDLSTPGNYWVRKIEASGNLSQPISLPLNPLASIPVSDGISVLLGYDLYGIFCIYSANRLGMLSGNVSTLILNPLDTAVYGKQSQTNIATLFYQRHGDPTNFPFTVVVFKAPVIINGTAKMFAGAGISLSGFVPATGLHRYASVFLRTDMTLEAFASTPTNLLDPLTVDTDIQDCINQATADSVIICAWEILAGDTALSPNPARNVDMRQIVNTGSSSGGSGNVITSGTYAASRPASPSTGDLYIPTDGRFTEMWNGAAWVFTDSGKVFVKPSSLSWSWINQSSAVLTSTVGIENIATITSAGGAQNVNLRVKSIPSVPYKITSHIEASHTDNTTYNFGILFRESGSGKFTTIGCEVDASAIYLLSNNYTNPTSFISTNTGFFMLTGEQPKWFQIEDNNTNRVYRYSWDGVIWFDLWSEGRTAGFTADQVGFCINPFSIANPLSLTLLTWIES